MKQFIKTRIESVIKHKVRVNTKLPNKVKSLNINLLEIPDYPNSSMITIEIAKNGMRTICLPPQNFAKLMETLESEISNCHSGKYENEFISGLYKSIPKHIYTKFECHRILFVSSKITDSILKNLLSLNTSESLKKCGIDVICLTVKNPTHNFSIRV